MTREEYLIQRLMDLKENYILEIQPFVNLIVDIKSRCIERMTFDGKECQCTYSVKGQILLNEVKRDIEDIKKVYLKEHELLMSFEIPKE